VVREYVNRPSNERVYSSNDRGANGNERVYSSRPAINDMPPPPAAICRSCGVVEFVKADTHEADGSGLGAVAGGVLGGVLGNGIGQGNGRSLATVAGVIGGAMIGNKVEKTQRQSTTWQVGVRLEDGNLRLVNSNTEPPWHTGDRVKLIDGAIAPRV
jgi:outer membrane lipoprotein SlyB